MTQIIVFKKIKSYLIPLFIRTGTLLFFFLPSNCAIESEHVLSSRNYGFWGDVRYSLVRHGVGCVCGTVAISFMAVRGIHPSVVQLDKG